MGLFVRTGTFNAATSTGNQSVSWSAASNWPNGTVPKALILYGAGTTDDDQWTTNWFNEGIGFSTSPSNQYTHSTRKGDALAGFRAMWPAAFAQINSSISIVRYANLVSFEANGFTLDWLTARSNGDYKRLNYIAIGGDDLTDAKVVNWQTPTTAGTKIVTGVGFRPDIALHVTSEDLYEVYGSNAAGAFTDTARGLGAMTESDQWTQSFFAPRDGTSARSRYQRDDKCLASISADGSVYTQASMSSFDADGFTLDFDTVGGREAESFSLCLAGGSYDVGSILKSTASEPVSQSVTGAGFEPSGILLTGVQDTAHTTGQAGLFSGFGASDGSSQFSTAIVTPQGSNTSQNTSNTNAVYTKVNTDSQTVDAKADLSSMDSDGFTLGWTTNDAVATSILYLAMGNDAPTVVDATVNLSAVTATASATTITTTTGAVARLSTATSTAIADSIDAAGGGNLSVLDATASSEALPPEAISGALLELPVATANAEVRRLVVETPDGYAYLERASASSLAQGITTSAGSVVSLLESTANAQFVEPVASVDSNTALGVATASSEVRNIVTLGSLIVRLDPALASSMAIQAVGASPDGLISFESTHATATSTQIVAKGGLGATIGVAEASGVTFAPTIVTGALVSLDTASATATARLIESDTPDGYAYLETAKAASASVPITVAVDAVTTLGSASANAVALEPTADISISSTLPSVNASSVAPELTATGGSTSDLGDATATGNAVDITLAGGAEMHLMPAGATAATDVIVIVQGTSVILVPATASAYAVSLQGRPVLGGVSITVPIGGQIVSAISSGEGNAILSLISIPNGGELAASLIESQDGNIAISVEGPSSDGISVSVSEPSGGDIAATVTSGEVPWIES